MADSSSLLTRCPNCNTRFRVTDEQLNVANGKVRCGHCMEIFDARARIDTDAQAPAKDSPPSQLESFSATDPHDDLVFEDNPEEDAAEGRYAGKSLSFSEDELSDSFREAGTPADRGDAADEDIESVDESWAEAILAEDQPNARTSAADATPAPEMPDTGDIAQHAGGNDVTAERLIAERSPHTPQPPAPRQSASAPATDNTPPLSSLDPDASGQTDARSPDTAEPAAPAESISASDARTAADDLSPYQQLSREPVAVRSSRRSLRGWLWSLLILALLAGLVSQVAWFQFDRLAAIPELRPWYEKACHYAGCQLDPLVALERIQSRKLVVRTDPDNRNALLVDAVIINQAEFEQPFPGIALTFSNLNGDVVAQSVFSPNDYLAGEGADMPAMPPGVPVRIAIGIRDPGRDAVNYNLRFVNRGSGS